jgi:hypothetical protein
MLPDCRKKWRQGVFLLLKYLDFQTHEHVLLPFLKLFKKSQVNKKDTN